MNNGTAWEIGTQPRFDPEMAITPTVRLFQTESGEGLWFIGGANRASIATHISKKRFSVSNNTGGAVTPVFSGAHGHFTAEAEL